MPFFLGAATVVLAVEGMMCQKSCGTTVANALRGVPGVQHAEASFADKTATVRGTAAVADLIDAVECVGFDATLLNGGAGSGQAGGW